MTTSPGGPPATLRVSTDCRPLIPVSEMTEAEKAWYRSNRERCWDCLCCLSTCRCRPRVKRKPAPRARPRATVPAQPVAEVIQFPSRTAAPAPERAPEPATPAVPPAPPGPPAPPAAVDAHLQHLALSGKRPNTVTHRARALARLQAWLGDTPLTDATPVQLHSWRVSIAGLSDATVVNYVSNTRDFYAWLAGEGYRADNPARKLPVPRQPRYRPRPISEDHLMAALSAADGRLRAWIVLEAWCGLRCIEVALLRLSCIHLDGSQPHIEVRADATKGGRDGRLVDLCAFAVDEIGRYLRSEMGRHAVAAGPWLFPRLDWKPGHVPEHVVSQLLCRHLRSLGYADTAHSLRHFFGTQAYAASNDVVAVQALMGHASPATTTGYVKVLAGRGAAIVGALPVPGAPGLGHASPATTTGYVTVPR